MRYPGRSDITQLRAIQKKVDDAAYATTAAAAMLSTASDMAEYAAIATADAKAAVDKVHAAAAATKTAEMPSHTDTTNPSTAATTTPKDLPNNNDSDPTRQPSSTSRPPTQPEEENSHLSQLSTILARTIHILLCIPWAALLILLLWSILIHARTAAHSLGIDDSHLTLSCSICAVLAVTFAIDAWLRAGRAALKLELAEGENARVDG
jgi:hypothetical protein